MKVLVVDDGHSIAEFMRAALGREGYEVRVGHNAADFLRQTRAWHPDIVLLDIMTLLHHAGYREGEDGQHPEEQRQEAGLSPQG